jgi:hypothetical protein
MRLAGLAVIACGCNGLFGLDPTHLPDAAPPDAPARCPELGGNIAFSPIVAQAILQNCTNLSISPPTGLIAATCISDSPTESFGGLVVNDGRLDDGLHPSDLTLHGVGTVRYARLLPEGDELWVEQDPGIAGSVQRYRRDDGGPWQWAGDLAFPELASGTSLPTITRGPNRRLMVVGATQIAEYIDDGTGTFTATTYAFADLGVDLPQIVNLTTDGLRAVIVEYERGFTGSVMRYIDRAAPEARFTASRIVGGTSPQVVDPLLTDDCGRLYYNGLDSVLYSEIQ